MPVQRIPRYSSCIFASPFLTKAIQAHRYKLLLQDLLKYTPINHMDRKDVESAYKLVEEGIVGL